MMVGDKFLLQSEPYAAMKNFQKDRNNTLETRQFRNCVMLLPTTARIHTRKLTISKNSLLNPPETQMIAIANKENRKESR